MATANKSNIGKFIIGGLIAYCVLQYFKFVNEETMKLTDIGFNGNYIDATFEVNNPTDLNGTIDNLTGNMLYQGIPIGTVSTNFETIPVRADLPFIGKVHFQPIYGNVFSAAIKAISHYNQNDFRFKGNMIFSGISIPIDTSLG